MVPLLAAKAFLGRVPRAVWIVAAVVAILLLGTCAHKRAVKKFGNERYQAGVSYEQARLKKAAEDLKAKADALTGKISIALREKHDEKVVVINRAADSLRLRGAGKAACPGNPGISAGPGRPNAASGRSDAAPVGLPVEERIAVPFGWVVDQAERCDMNRQEVLTWRDWHKKQSEAWKSLSAR